MLRGRENAHDSGDTAAVPSPLAILAASLSGLDATRWRPPLPVSHLVLCLPRVFRNQDLDRAPS
jgi:hypothetical protein